MVSPRKMRPFTDVLQHAWPSCSKDFWPGPNVLDIQRGTNLRNDFVGLGHEPTLLKGEFESQTAGSLSPPHTAAVRAQLLGDRSQYMLHQPVGNGFPRQRIQGLSKGLRLAAGKFLRCAKRLSGLFAFGAVPQDAGENQFPARI